MSVGKKIAGLLFERQKTQKQVAEELQIACSTLNNYIRDYREPDVETLKLLAGYFGVTMDFLLDFQPRLYATAELNDREQEMLSLYKMLKNEQQEFLIKQTKLLIEMNGGEG